MGDDDLRDAVWGAVGEEVLEVLLDLVFQKVFLILGVHGVILLHPVVMFLL